METLVIVAISLVAAVAVLHPIVRRRADPAADVEVRIDGEVDRYRRALRAGVVCPECLEANPPGSRYCAECGTALGPADAGTPEPGNAAETAGAADGGEPTGDAGDAGTADDRGTPA